MKYLLAAIILVPVLGFSQDCKVKKTTDPYTREIKLSSGPIQLQGATLSIDADNKEVDFFFSVDGKEKCFSDASNIVIVYEGTRVKGNFRNNGPMNCDGIFHVIFKNQVTTPALLQRLLTQKITSIEFVSNTKTKTLVSFSPEEQQSLMTRGECLVKEAKTLIK
jgi:hypothetical protein